MSEDTEDALSSLIWIGMDMFTETNPVVMVISAIILAFVLGYFISNLNADSDCQKIAGSHYERLNGVCYRVTEDGAMVPVKEN